MPITTIPFSARKAGPYMASAGQTVFSFGFPVLAAGDLTVWRDRAGELTQLLPTTHYTVAGAGEQSGGSVTLSSGAEEGDIIAIDGSLNPQRATSFIGGVPFKTSFIDSDLNRLSIMVQELAREVSRAIRRAPVDEQSGSLLLPRYVTETSLLALTVAGELIGVLPVDLGAGAVATAYAKTLLDDVTAAQARSTLGFRFVSVKDHGAVGDDITDDSAAFQAAFDEAMAAGEAVGIPAGKYYLGNTSLTWANAPCCIRGDGIGISVLRWNGSSGGIVISQDADDYFSFVGDLSLYQSGAGVGTALSYDGSGQKSGGILVNRTSPRLFFRNLAIRGTTSPATDGWNKHIVCNNAIHAVVDNAHVEGKFLTTQPNIQSTSAFHFFGDGSPVEILVINSWAFYVAETVVAEQCEGVFVDHCNFVAVGKGVKFTSSGSDPQLCVTNNHINAYVNCVLADNLIQGQVLNNLLYSRDDSTGNVILLKFGDNCDDCNISNNILNKTSGNTDTGIEFGGTAGSSGSVIRDNILTNLNVGISITPGATGTEVTGNRYTNVATPYSDLGTSTMRHNDNHDGSVPKPAWTFKGDEDTGWYRIGPNTMGAGTGGVAAIAIDGAQSIRALSPTGGLGYGTGAGGAVTQPTNKSTTVTINKVCGEIILNAASLGGGVLVAFAVLNSAVAVHDNIIINHVSGGTGGAYRVTADSIGAGSFAVRVTNITGAPLSEAIVLGFTVIKTVIS